MPEQVAKEFFDLYNGLVRVELATLSHRYRVSEDAGKYLSCPSVTTVLNCLAKPAITPWSVKTVCDYMEDNLRLLLSGNSFSVEAVFRVIAEARTAHERERQKAADIGTEAHDWLEAYWLSIVRKTDTPPMPADGPVRNCVDAALDWIKDHDMKPILFERPFYSRLHKFTGKEDFVGMVDGELSIIDYKSSNGIYPETALQTAAYAKMYEEEFGVPVARRWALKLGKHDGKVEPKPYPPETLELDWQAFLHVLFIYTRFKHLRRVPKKEKEDYLAEI